MQFVQIQLSTDFPFFKKIFRKKLHMLVSNKKAQFWFLLKDFFVYFFHPQSCEVLTFVILVLFLRAAVQLFIRNCLNPVSSFSHLAKNHSTNLKLFWLHIVTLRKSIAFKYFTFTATLVLYWKKTATLFPT